MLSEEEKLKSIEKIKLLKEECKNIKQEFEKAKEQREMHFQKKESLKKEISTLIFKIRNVKGQNDSVSNTINQLKQQRDSYNKKVKELISKIKDLNTKKVSMLKGSLVNVRGIKEQIDDLEKSIEINAYKYDKEQKITEKIKKLKKLYNDNLGLVKLSDESRNISNEIDSSKKIADDFHKKLDETIKQSKGQGSEFMELSKKISLLKQEQEKEFEEFKKCKSECNNLFSKYKEKSNEISSINASISSDNLQKRNIEKDQQKKAISEKVKLVKEKLKKEKRLTTEDLIILQADESN